MRRFRSAIIGFVAIEALSAAAAGREISQQREETAHFIGATGCSSSSCHGGAGEKRSQYITWSRQDFHSRANPILLNARSLRIAESLGIGEAQGSARCTVCHSPFQALAPARRASTAHPDEGVSCESCHGAAAGWLRGHTRPDWTHAMRVSAGMRDLKNLYVRANTCVACHQNVDKDVLQAGHPALLFELDSQSINEPKHWRDEDPASGARSWLTGQAVALREAAWRSRVHADPAADSQETAVALAWLLAKVTRAEPMLPKIAEPVSSDLEPLQNEADQLARRAANWSANADSAMAMLQSLVETDGEFTVAKDRTSETLSYRARRLVLGIDRLAVAVNQNRSVPLKIEKELGALRQDIVPPGRLDPPRFAEHLRALREKL